MVSVGHESIALSAGAPQLVGPGPTSPLSIGHLSTGRRFMTAGAGKRLRRGITFLGDTTETAINSATTGEGPAGDPAGAFVLWARGLDMSGLFFRWWDGSTDNRIQLMVGAGGVCRMFVEENNVSGVVDHLGSTVVDDGDDHMLALVWSAGWTQVQLYVDGVADGALQTPSNQWSSPVMSGVSVTDGTFTGDVLHAARFDFAPTADWILAAHAAGPPMEWPHATNEWLMGDTIADRRGGMALITDVRGPLDLTTAGIDASNLVFA